MRPWVCPERKHSAKVKKISAPLKYPITMYGKIINLPQAFPPT
jgi:hypothetical protein